MKPNLPLLWDRIHTSYWFYPGMMLLAGGFAALALTALDERVGDKFSGPLVWIYQGGADGARAMLAAIATAVLGVAGTTFSITVAILSLTTSQFGPRLLRNFLSDTGNQVVLGTFIATFLYCLLVMRTVRSIEETSFVPHLSVTGGVVLAVVCAAMLVYFIHHIVNTIQAANFIAHAGEELIDSIDRLYPAHIGDAAPEPAAKRLRQDAKALDLLALRSGYVQAWDGEALLAIAREAGGTIELLKAPGQFVAQGTALARMHNGEARKDDLCLALDGAVSLGTQATPVQDITQPLNALAEIAMRALSPSLNDPNTALMCIDRLSAAYCALIARDFPTQDRADDDGTPRLIACAPTFDELVHLGFDPIRRHGRSHVGVLLRLLDSLADIASCSGDKARCRVLAEVADQVLEAGDEGLPAADDRKLLAARHKAVREALGLRPRAARAS